MHRASSESGYVVYFPASGRDVSSGWRPAVGGGQSPTRLPCGTLVPTRLEGPVNTAAKPTLLLGLPRP